MTPLLASSLALLVGAVVTVEGAGTCPTTAEVAARVTALLPSGAADAPPDVVRLTEQGDGLLVALSRPDGAAIGERTIARDGTCADLAAAAAIVVATWESDVHVEFRPPAPEPAPANLAGTTETPPVVAVSPPAPARRRASLEAGAALTGSFAPSSAGAGPGLGALLVVSSTPADRRVGMRLALTADAEREVPLGDGQVVWRRVMLALGPTARLARPRAPWAVDLYAEALFGVVTATGKSFARDIDAVAFDPGISVGTRLRWRRAGTVVPWLAVEGQGWPRPQIAYAAPDGASAILPRVQLSLALGVSVRAGP
jgi:hypothetical protein